jgi:surface antigen
MRTFVSLMLAGLVAATSLAPDAYARPRDRDDYYRGYYYDNRYDRYDNRYNDRYDNRYYRNDRGRHNGWWKKHSWYNRYNYEPYAWERVDRYTYPAGYRRGSEVRCTDNYNPFGLLLGGVAGGALGSTIGSGHGRTAAIASGALLGGLLGNNLTQQRCSEYVFRDAPVGRPISWQAGPREAYAVVPTRDYRDNGQYCREYQAYATVGGRRSQTYGMACMQPDGSWRVVS